MSIISSPPGGTAYVYSVLAEVINAAWDQANTKHTAFETKVSTAQNELPDISTTLAGIDITAGTVSTPTVVEPSVTIPTDQSGSAFDMFDTKYLELVALLSDKFTAFRATYFPDESAAYTAAEDWAQGALANPSGGLPAAVQEQLLEDERSRILADADRASADVLATFATKRFGLPPGAAAAAVLQIQQKSQDEIAAGARKVTVASIENMKSAVEVLIKNRQSAMASAVEYIKALASGPDMASKLVNVGYDAQSKLISAVSQFYNSRIAAAELNSKVGQFNVSTALQAAEKNQAADLQTIEMKIKTLLTEAQALAQMTTSLYNNLHAQASAQGSDSVTSTV